MVLVQVIVTCHFETINDTYMPKSHEADRESNFRTPSVSMNFCYMYTFKIFYKLCFDAYKTSYNSSEAPRTSIKNGEK